MNAVVRRARPMLGTLVEMRVEGLAEADALVALNAAFAEVDRVHALMSFHASDSDLARIHAAQVGATVEVDPRTIEVLTMAQQIAELTNGAFNVAVAASLVSAGALPRPQSPFAPDPGARSTDIELLDGRSVRLHRALWIDLGGIAKGYAVDRAVNILLAHGATQLCVNAGGDLRVCGARAEPVHLRAGDGVAPAQPALELQNAAIASSATDAARVHRCGRTHAVIAAGASVAVIAAQCVVADALTKVVLAADAGVGARALAHFGATAARHDQLHGWQPQDQAA